MKESDIISDEDKARLSFSQNIGQYGRALKSACELLSAANMLVSTVALSVDNKIYGQEESYIYAANLAASIVSASGRYIAYKSDKGRKISAREYMEVITNIFNNLNHDQLQQLQELFVRIEQESLNKEPDYLSSTINYIYSVKDHLAYVPRAIVKNAKALLQKPATDITTSGITVERMLDPQNRNQSSWHRSQESNDFNIIASIV